MTVLSASRQFFLLAFLTTLFLYVNCAPAYLQAAKTLKVACTTMDRFKVKGTGTSCKTILITNNKKRERDSNGQRLKWPISLAGSRPALPGCSQSISMLKPRSDPTRPPNGWEPPVPDPKIPSQTPRKPRTWKKPFRHYDTVASNFGQSAERQRKEAQKKKKLTPMSSHITGFRDQHPGPAPAPPGPQHPSAPQHPPGTMTPAQMYINPPSHYGSGSGSNHPPQFGAGPSVPQHPPAPPPGTMAPTQMYINPPTHYGHNSGSGYSHPVLFGSGPFVMPQHPSAPQHPPPPGTMGPAQMYINPPGHHSGGSGSNHPQQSAPSQSQSPRPNSPSKSTPKSRKGNLKGKRPGKGKGKGKGAKHSGSGSPGSPGPSSKKPRH